jgi:alkanesulfonate monooxygenase SsuD/methylene tetrahydromethanopterin reductase-like flavin-dependent oxidoreductase (luciferase family)
MDFGASMFFTDYSMTPAELAQALEARGFESVWAPEHSHIPSSRLTPPAGGGELGKQYYDVMDPFVTLTAAAIATKTLKVATGVCLVIQRDTIQTAKLVASIDHVSGGRFLFGDLDQIRARISRRDRQCSQDADLAKAGAEA